MATGAPSDRPGGTRLGRWYRALAIFVLNTLVALVVADGLAAAYLAWAGHGPAPAPAATPAGGTETREQVIQRLADLNHTVYGNRAQFFPGMSAVDIRQLLVDTLDTYLGGFVYEPYAQFRERPHKSRFVNVDPGGFRWGRRRGPWPPEPTAINVFVFGGSTTFGYGLPDDETVPSHLADLLADRAGGRRVAVYNFGRGYYFSTQERTLFERLLAQGFVPDVAIFLDGLNDFYNLAGDPEFTSRLAHLMEEEQTGKQTAGPVLELVRSTALARAASQVGARLATWRAPAPPAAGAGASVPAVDPRPGLHREHRALNGVIRRIRMNQRMVDALGALYGVQTLIVWQPVPTYKYDLRYHVFATHPLFRHEASRRGYPLIARAVARRPMGPSFVWCADIQDGVHEALYVDAIHYSPAMAGRVATCIVQGMEQASVTLRKRLDRPH